MKDKFYNHVKEVLLSRGYKLTEDNTYILEEIQRQGDMQVNINGVTQVIPGQEISLTKIITITGEGDVDGRGFAQILFTVKKGNEEVNTGLPEECMYFDDLNFFDHWVSYL